MLFCPTCANLLVISSQTGYNKWACNTYVYEFPISKQMTSRSRMKRKEVDDVLGGEETWRDADSTVVTCDKCGHPRAYFYQLQIRSADEPMATCACSMLPLGWTYETRALICFFGLVYRCAGCAYQWREN
ncbi:uncharacterized protein EDB91DRAFT_435177 [Suillus paluster]|uniref:uncharacterized protein n=1 Tax=Suillus paluster TaxID=48578 RepID=UPI001B862FCB|nr:uncharacterized protein EDB91DRAFT_435177 [Suillus paluster]KAG1754071.1 hypothetical protein EDB91DRAFT_435177 [Suillus paluster]